MALKALMLKKKIDQRKAELAKLKEITESFTAREAELEANIAEKPKDTAQSKGNDIFSYFALIMVSRTCPGIKNRV